MQPDSSRWHVRHGGHNAHEDPQRLSIDGEKTTKQSSIKNNHLSEMSFSKENDKQLAGLLKRLKREAAEEMKKCTDIVACVV